MKFRLTKTYIYDWPVKLSVPDPDQPGKFVEQEFVGRFAAMPRDEAMALDAEIAALLPLEQTSRQDDVLRRVLVGWPSGVEDETGKPVPFTPEALEEAIQFSWFRAGVYRAYAESLRGAASGN